MADLVRDGPYVADQTTPQTSVPPPLAQSIHCFRTAERPRRSRTRFTTEEKEKVLGVRRQGACLRCRILKIQCSLENPCQPCLQSAVKGSERKVLSFCYCVRTRFADVNIFDSSSPAAAAAAMQTETLMRAMSGLLARIATPADFTLTSNPTAFNNTMVSWLTDPTFHLPNGSIVGLCCSSLLGLQFREDTPSEATDGFVTDFRRFLLTTSLVHAGWRGSCSSSMNNNQTIRTRDLHAAGHLSGARLLKRLDRILTPQFLSRCDRDSCQVLFLLVLGAVLGVGYSSTLHLEHHHHFSAAQFPPAVVSDDDDMLQMLDPEFQRSPTLWLAMKEHLCQMLAHHLIFLASVLGIKLETGLERRIIETAVRRWGKAEEFVWAEGVGMETLEREFGQSGIEGRGAKGRGMDGAVKPEDGNKESVMGNRSLKSPVLSGPPQTPAPPLLVPVACPDVKRFEPKATEAWSDNPSSYLSMFDGLDSRPENATPGEVPPSGTGPEARFQRQNLEPPTRREVKRRSIWVVRPFDAGPEHGLINVHSRLRGGLGMDTLRAFV